MDKNVLAERVRALLSAPADAPEGSEFVVDGVRIRIPAGGAAVVLIAGAHAEIHGGDSRDQR